MQQPAPELGEDDAADREVDRFYKFWFAFKSWREFPHPDEEDIEQAECREDRWALTPQQGRLRGCSTRNKSMCMTAGHIPAVEGVAGQLHLEGRQLPVTAFGGGCCQCWRASSW